MSMTKLALMIMFLHALPHAESDSASDSRILQEIADSLKVPLERNIVKWENGRVAYLSIYYRGQRGAIPPALGGLDSLRRIQIGLTSVTHIPKEIGLLKRLDTIDIGSSSIGPALPEEIGGLPNLRYLRVYGCKLETLPTSLMKLQKLEYVDFSYNAICQVDDSLRQWILAKWPRALDNQNTSNCVTTGLGPRKSPPGKATLRRLSVPGTSDVTPGQSRATEDIRYYTPVGRSLKGQDLLVPPETGARE